MEPVLAKAATSFRIIGNAIFYRNFMAKALRAREVVALVASQAVMDVSLAV
jgi:hypothetical protein